MITARKAFLDEKWINKLIEIDVPYQGKEPITITYDCLNREEVDRIKILLSEEKDKEIRSQIFCIIGLTIAHILNRLEDQYKPDLIETENTYLGIFRSVVIQDPREENLCYKIALRLLLHFYGKTKNEDSFNWAFHQLVTLN